MEKIQKRYLQAEIIENLLVYIESEGLQPGDKLPSQDKLTEMLGVSRTSLREATKTLEARNVIRIVNGKGAFVSEQKQTFDFAVLKEKELVLELLDVRMGLEQEIIQLVVEKATDEEFSRMGEKLEIMLKRYEAGEIHIPEDRDFHHLIYKACHNKLLIDVISYISKNFDLIWDNPLGMAEYLSKTTPMHKELYDHLVNRDARRAKQINNRMITEIKRYVKEYF